MKTKESQEMYKKIKKIAEKQRKTKKDNEICCFSSKCLQKQINELCWLLFNRSKSYHIGRSQGDHRPKLYWFSITLLLLFKLSLNISEFSLWFDVVSTSCLIMKHLMIVSLMHFSSSNLLNALLKNQSLAFCLPQCSHMSPTRDLFSDSH